MRRTVSTGHASFLGTSVARLAVAGLVATLVAGSVLAEVSVNGHGSSVYFQGQPGQHWTKQREGVPSSSLLNPFGDIRGDSAPSIAVNPASGLPEVAWGRAGTWPAVMFASWDPEGEKWEARDIPRAAGASSWAGRVVQLLHDQNGNRLVVFDDPVTGRILLGSAPPYSQHLNRPIRLNVTGNPGAGAHPLWDGERLVVGYGRLDGIGAAEIVEIELALDHDGWIPNGGEGVPGIPDPVFSYAGNGPTVGGGPGTPGMRIPVLAGPLGDIDVPPTLMRIEPLGDGRLLASWIDGTRLAYTIRSADRTWAEVAWAPLAEVVDHEDARADLRRTLTRTRR